jgi:K+-sensing histidine kinase KdpD
MAARGDTAEVRLHPAPSAVPARAPAALGLSVAQGIASALGGTLAVEAPDGGSACVAVTLPLAVRP